MVEIVFLYLTPYCVREKQFGSTTKVLLLRTVSYLMLLSGASFIFNK
jgi:hypothetical protein